jgi:hypothetical protein
MGGPRTRPNYSIDGIETLHDTEERMAKRFVLLAAAALATGALAACTSPTAPTSSASPQMHRVNAPAQSAGTLIGSEG